MRKLSFRICAFVITALACFLVIFPMTVFADTTKQAETSSASGTSFEITVDVNDRYTGGLNYGDDKLSQNFSGKALYIGVICFLLLAGVIIIAVRARRFDDDEDSKDEKGNGDE